MPVLHMSQAQQSAQRMGAGLHCGGGAAGLWRTSDFHCMQCRMRVQRVWVRYQADLQGNFGQSWMLGMRCGQLCPLALSPGLQR